MVLVIVTITKTLDGAWIVITMIPILVTIFKLTRTHYESVAGQLSLANVEVDTTPHGHIVIVPIGGVHRAVSKRCATPRRSPRMFARFTSTSTPIHWCS